MSITRHGNRTLFVPAPDKSGRRWYGTGMYRSPENKARCIVAVSEGGRAPTFHQCLYKRRYGPDNAFCRIHDPSRLDAEEKKRQAEAAKQATEDAAIVREGRRLARKLGLRDTLCDDTWKWPHRPVRRLIVPFNQLEKLIERLSKR